MSHVAGCYNPTCDGCDYDVSYYKARIAELETQLNSERHQRDGNALDALQDRILELEAELAKNAGLYKAVSDSDDDETIEYLTQERGRLREALSWVWNVRALFGRRRKRKHDEHPTDAHPRRPGSDNRTP